MRMTRPQTQTVYPLHWAIWEDKPDDLRRLLSCDNQPLPDNTKKTRLEQQDARGRTPLMLSVVLKRIKCSEILLECGADATALNKDYWSVTDEAICSKDSELLKMCLMYREFQRSVCFNRLIAEILDKLSKTTDFYVELKWEFNSWVPFVSQMCPSDVYKVYKRGSNVRVDTTLVGFENNQWKRGRQSYVFKTTDKNQTAKFYIVDHEAKTVFSEHISEKSVEGSEQADELLNFAPTQDVVDQMLKSPITTLYVDLDNVAFERKTGGFFGLGSEKTEVVNGYDCKVFNTTNVNLITKSRTEHLDEECKKTYQNSKSSMLDTVFSWVQGSETKIKGPNHDGNLTADEYFFPNSPHEMKKDIGRPKELSIRKRSFNASLCLCDQYPLSLIEQVVPIVDIMASTNVHFSRLKDFLTLHLPSGFPLKIEIPIFHVLNAVVTFGNVHAECSPVSGVTFISDPNYKCCALDDDLFDFPSSYSTREMGAEQYNWADNEELALLQYAIRESLTGELGTEPNQLLSTVDQEDVALQRALDESMRAYYGSALNARNGSCVVSALESDRSNGSTVASVVNNNGADLEDEIHLALAMSEQEENARKEALKDEELELRRILDLSLEEK